MANVKTGLSELYQRQRLLQIGIFSLVTVIVWVGFSLIRSQQKTSISPELRKLAEPLTPSINEEVITELEGKRFYTAQELSAFPIYKIQVSVDGRSESVVTIDTPEPVAETTSRVVASPTPSPSPTTGSPSGPVISPTITPISTPSAGQ